MRRIQRIGLFTASTAFQRERPPEKVAGNSEFPSDTLSPNMFSRLLRKTAYAYKGIRSFWLTDKITADIYRHIGHLKSFKLINEMSTNDLALSLWALATMRLTWGRLEKPAQATCLNALVRNAPRMNPQNIANSVWALATMGLTWDRLEESVQAACLNTLIRNAPRMKTQEAANSVWALAIMLPPTDSIGIPSTLNALFTRLCSSKPEHLTIKGRSAILLSMQYFKPSLTYEVIKAVKEYIGPCNPTKTTESRAQAHVSTHLSERLKDSDIGICFEIDVGSVPADIFIPSRKLVIEIDGPHHKTRRQQSTDRLVNTIRTRNGITVLRIDITDSSYNFALLDSLSASIKANCYTALDEIKCVAAYYPSPAPVKAVDRRDYRLFSSQPKLAAPESSRLNAKAKEFEYHSSGASEGQDLDPAAKPYEPVWRTSHK
ncbi:MAG: hypothetical protein P1U63_12270 [Coxiellaceae bacterium]|nr:hypothetical protein [Coxiellaceae bacterium]